MTATGTSVSNKGSSTTKGPHSETSFDVSQWQQAALHRQRGAASQTQLHLQPDAGRHPAVMPCYHPLKGWPSRRVNPSGKRSLTFSEASGFGSPVEVPCGQCIGCRLERARQWSVRIMHEARYYDETSFLTLTYADEHLPPSGSLDKPAYQRFLKRLRSASAPLRLRFLGCGEYGDNLGRPHYHLIILGRSFREDRKRWRRGSNGDNIYISDSLRALWPYGDSYVGSVTEQSAGYVARYALKKVNGPAAAAHYQGRTPEFMTCSQGLGGRWFEEFSSDVFPDDFVVMKGKRLRVPRYYDKQLPEDLLEEVKARRVERALQHADNNTPERRAVRETVARARTTLLKRELT